MGYPICHPMEVPVGHPIGMTSHGKAHGASHRPSFVTYEILHRSPNGTSPENSHGDTSHRMCSRGSPLGYHGNSGHCRVDTNVNPFRTAVPFWGQTSQISSSFVPKRDRGSKGVKIQGDDLNRLLLCRLSVATSLPSTRTCPVSLPFLAPGAGVY